MVLSALLDIICISQGGNSVFLYQVLGLKYFAVCIIIPLRKINVTLVVVKLIQIC